MAKSNNKIPVGLSLPLQRGSNGYFNQNFNTIDQAYSNIKNLLLTMTGERRMNVNFGSPLYSLLFEQVTDEEEFVETLSSRIRNVIDLYFPYVNINRLDISFSEYNTNMININITFQLKNSSNTQFGASETRTLNLTVNTTV